MALTRWSLTRDMVSTERYYRRVLSLFVEGGANWEDKQRQLREVAAVVRRHGARLLLAVFPFEDQLHAAASRAPQQLPARFARVEGIAFTDVTRGPERHAGRALDQLGDNIPLSPLGPRVMAEILFEDLTLLLGAWGLAAARP